MTQTITDTNAEYRVLFSGTNDNTTRTEGARKDGEFRYNPNIDTLYVPSIRSSYVYGTQEAFRHLDAGLNSVNADHYLYIGYGGRTFTKKTLFYYSTGTDGTDTRTSNTEFFEINSNGAYALTRFGINGQNTSYTLYTNGSSYFTNTITGDILSSWHMLGGRPANTVNFNTHFENAANLHHDTPTRTDAELSYNRWFLSNSDQTNYGPDALHLPVVDSHVLSFGIDNNAAYSRHLAFDIRTNAIYTRARTNNSWGNWEQLVRNTGTWGINVTGTARYLENRGGNTVSVSDGPWSVQITPSGHTNRAIVWHQRWKQSGLTYTPSGGAATTLTDGADVTWWLSSANASNNLQLNMQIDGSFYAANHIQAGSWGYIPDFRSEKIRLHDNWVGFYTSNNAGGNRLGYIQTDGSYMYFRKENGNNGFSFNGNLVPDGTNSRSLGTSSLRWKNLLIGDADTYGNHSVPIYWNGGVPAPVNYINTHCENNGIIIPFTRGNDLAWLYARGGSVHIYEVATSVTDFTPATLTVSREVSTPTDDLLFDGTFTYNSFTISATATTVIIDITAPGMLYHSLPTWIDFGSTGWGCSKIQWFTRVNTTDAFTLRGTTETATKHHYINLSNGSTGVRCFRLVCTNWANTNIRIAEIGCNYYSSIGQRNTLMSRGKDDSIYRSITPAKHNTYTLGSSDYRWSYVYSTNFYGSLASLGTNSPDTSSLLTVQGEASDSHGCIHIIDTRTNAGWHYPLLATNSNLATSASMYICIGKAAATGKSAGLRYSFVGDSSDNNLMGFEFYGQGTKLWANAAGDGGVARNWSAPSGSIWAGSWTANTAGAAERDIGTMSGAGRIYLYSVAATNGARGIYLINAAGTGGTGIAFDQSNNISTLATFAANTATYIRRGGVSMAWNKGRDGALLRQTSVSGYSPFISVKTVNGSWDIGAYNHTDYQDDLIFSYVTDSDYSNNNRTTAQMQFQEDGTVRTKNLFVYNRYKPSTGSNTAAVTSSPYKGMLWTYNLGIAKSTLASGDVIMIKTPAAGHDYGVFISVDNGTTYKPIVVGTGANRLTTHYQANTTLMLMYDSSGQSNSMYGQINSNGTVDGTTGRVNVSGGVWRIMNLYDSGNPGDWNLRQYTIKAAAAVRSVHVIGGTDAGYKEIDGGNAFDIRYSVLYCGSDIASGNTGNNNYLHHYSVNIRNSSNSNVALTAYKNVYIKGTLSGTTFTPVSGGSPFVQDLPTANDSYVYYYIGRCYSANAITFDSTSRAMYIYKNGAVRNYTDPNPLKIYYYGSDAENTAGWYKMCTVSQSGYSDCNLNLLITSGYNRQAAGLLYVHVRCDNGTANNIRSLKWMYRYGWDPGDVYFKDNGNNTWSLYVKQTNSRYGRVQVQILSETSTSASQWNLVWADNTTKESADPSGGTAATDGATVNFANSATSATQATHSASANYASSAAQATHAASAAWSSSAGYASSAAQATHAACANYVSSAGRLSENSSTNSSDPGGLTWFNINGTKGAAVDTNDTPSSAWWYINRNRHTNTTNDYYTDVAIPFNDLGIYYKNVRNGVITNNRWIKVLDDLNYNGVVHEVNRSTTLTSGSWSSSPTNGFYTYTLTVTASGGKTMTTSDDIHISAYYAAAPTGVSAYNAISINWAKINAARITDNNKVTFYAANKPNIHIPITYEIVYH